MGPQPSVAERQDFWQVMAKYLIQDKKAGSHQGRSRNSSSRI